MGRIVVRIKIENLIDVLLAERGDLPPEQVRSVEVDALVDTSARALERTWTRSLIKLI